MLSAFPEDQKVRAHFVNFFATEDFMLVFLGSNNACHFDVARAAEFAPS